MKSFPKGREFDEQYKSHFEDNYLAEKTLPTVKSWLEGKSAENYDIVVEYALYDYKEYVSKIPQMKVMFNMMNDMYRSQIKDALDKMSETV